MAKRQAEPTTETIDQSLLEQVLASSEARAVIDQQIAKRVAIDTASAVRYKPIGGQVEIEISLERLNRQIPSTAKGRRPPRLTLEEFMQTCLQYRLNPYARDIYLIGYDDDRNNSANWSVILSYHSLLKRAREFKDYDGFQCGIVVDDEGELKELVGTCSATHHKLVGAWCKVYVKGLSVPVHVTVDLEERAKDRGEWKKQQKWMIQKCAIAAGFRFAFPNDSPPTIETDEELGIDDIIAETNKRASAQAPAKPTSPASTAAALAGRAVIDTLGKFKGELSMDLRRATGAADVLRLRDLYLARAGGEIDKLEFCEQQCEKAMAKLAAVPESNDIPPVDPRPQGSNDEHGDAWEGEEDLAAIEAQIARES